MDEVDRALASPYGSSIAGLKSQIGRVAVAEHKVASRVSGSRALTRSTDNGTEKKEGQVEELSTI
jgi:hypothetical protein